MSISAAEAPPVVTFYRLIDQARLPQRADRSAAGTLPMRAARYCDAITSAAAFGWYLFPAMAFSLLWDGTEIFWTYGEQETWMPLETAQYPGLVRRFDAVVPDSVKGCSPPFLSALPEPGTVQLWSGLIARTAPDWSLLVRPVANLPRTGGFELYEGIVETDRWFGPLFSNLRLTRTHTPVRFRPDLPIAQIQPLPRWDATLNAMAIVPGLDDLDAADWDAYERDIVRPNMQDDRMPGSYAVAARRRRKTEGGCPRHAAGAGPAAGTVAGTAATAGAGVSPAGGFGS